MRQVLRLWSGLPLWQRVVAGLVLGVVVGLVSPGLAHGIAIVGELFTRAIKMLVVPIVLITIAAGITGLGDPRQLGPIGGRTLGLFVITTLIAVAVGMGIGLVVHPGQGVTLGAVVPHALGGTIGVRDQILGIIPVNVLDALARGDMIAIIFFAVLLGVGTVLAGDAGRPLANLLQSAAAVLLHIVRLVMAFTPLGVLALIANAVAAHGLSVFVTMGWLALCVVLGSLVQMLVVHSLMLRLIGRLPLLPFFRKIVDALIVAFSTASSSATLPVSMRIARDDLGVAEPVMATVLPLGASIGKDGTAMYVGLLGQFSLQVLGIAPDATMLGFMFATGVLAAFGTAPVPSASLFMLAAMLGSVGVSPEQTALIVGLVLPFDRLLDMTRTVPSACANITVATLVARGEGQLDEARYRSSP
jgi:Na+/H+-dicarboxylate symporter